MEGKYEEKEKIIIQQNNINSFAFNDIYFVDKYN